MGKLHCVKCGGKLSRTTKVMQGVYEPKTGRPAIHECVICHNCKIGWDLTEPNPYLFNRPKAGNKLIDAIAIFSLLMTCLLIGEVGIAMYGIPLFWLTFYLVWYKRAKKDILLDESGLKQSLTAIFIAFFIPIGFVIMF